MELQGKTVNFLGDSITEGVGVTDISNRYDNALKNMVGLKAVYNYGIGGTRIAYQTTPSDYPAHDLFFCGRAYWMNKTADVIVVYGGVNDWMHGDAPFGKIGDTTQSTFCGAVDLLMRILKQEYANAKIVFLTPAHACPTGLSDKSPSTWAIKRDDAKPLESYVDVIEKTGKKYDIPVFNLYQNLGINPNDESQREMYTVDGLHFNDKGHIVLAEKLADFLRSL